MLSLLLAGCPIYCKDTDSGKAYYVKGNLTDYDDDFPGPNGEIILLASDCCVPDNFDLDDVIIENAEVIVPCVSESRNLYEPFCYNRAYNATIYPCPYGCVNGTCVKNCTETDNGLDLLNNGTATGYFEIIRDMYHAEDCCVVSPDDINNLEILPHNTISPPCVDRSDYLFESYCNRENLNFGIYPCVDGCVNGECVNISSQNCTETDAGIDFFNKGNCTVYSDYGLEEEVSDSCVSEITLNECYCNVTTLLTTQYPCPTRCVDGECISF